MGLETISVPHDSTETPPSEREIRERLLAKSLGPYRNTWISPGMYVLQRGVEAIGVKGLVNRQWNIELELGRDVGRGLIQSGLSL